MSIIENLDEPLLAELSSYWSKRRSRCCLAGTQIEEPFGCTLTNRFLDELKQGPYRDDTMGPYHHLMAEVAPRYCENGFGKDGTNTLRATRLMLPLSDDQETANRVPAGIVYVDSDSNDRMGVLHSQDSFNSPSPESHWRLHS